MLRLGGYPDARFQCSAELKSYRNAVEPIVGIIALAKKEIIIVQTSLVGSMLSNLLLVLGIAFPSEASSGWSNTST